jgi:asparagine synthase (glutamine-hydrolysing)
VCGIIGIWSKNQNIVPRDKIEKMLKLIKHRGPDASGVWINSCLGFGHDRLKIIDLSDKANQPYTDGNDALTFNGEIYNYISLRKELSSKYNFKTSSDTEVLFHALQEWGENALHKLNGQYAFAFFSQSSNTLFLARDHVGICPLYIYENENEFYFSSEIKPLLTIKRFSLNKEGIVDYFTYRYNIQNGRTLFNEIIRFTPGNYIKIDLLSGEKIEKPYWRIKFGENDISDELIQKQFNDILDDEIKLQKVADVPVGLYLSGGIDSGALLKGFAKSSAEIKSFTLSFSKDDQDASRVLELSKQYNFQRNLLQFSQEDLLALEDVIFSMEEPFGDLIITANYLLAKKASESIKVVLSGEGGDEIFCGYDHQRSFLNMISISQKKFISSLAKYCLQLLPIRVLSVANSYPGIFEKEEKFRINNVYKHIHNPAEAYIDLISLFHKSELTDLFSTSFSKHCMLTADTYSIKKIFANEKNVWQAIVRCEVEQLTLIVNLLKQDRFAMRFSMEGRVPLVSRKVIEFVSSLPVNVICSAINKEILLNYSGNKIIKKKPFSLISTQYYLKHFIQLFDAYITRDNIVGQNILSWVYVLKIRAALERGNILVVKKAMAILIFAVWLKKYEGYYK